MKVLVVSSDTSTYGHKKTATYEVAVKGGIRIILDYLLTRGVTTGMHMWLLTQCILFSMLLARKKQNPHF